MTSWQEQCIEMGHVIIKSDALIGPCVLTFCKWRTPYCMESSQTLPVHNHWGVHMAFHLTETTYVFPSALSFQKHGSIRLLSNKYVRETFQGLIGRCFFFCCLQPSCHDNCRWFINEGRRQHEVSPHVDPNLYCFCITCFSVFIPKLMLIYIYMLVHVYRSL